MKLRVGANWDFSLVENLKGTSVDTPFGKLPFDVVGGARPGFILPQVNHNYVKRYIHACHENGLEFGYLLNAPCLGNLQYSRRGYRQLIKLLEWIDQSGVDSVVVGIPYLIDLIRKRFVRFKVKVSTAARVNTVRKALQYEAMGVEEIIIDEHANHDSYAPRKGEEEKYCYLQYPGYLCLYRNLVEPVELLKPPWIRPEDISYYENLKSISSSAHDRAFRLAPFAGSPP